MKPNESKTAVRRRYSSLDIHKIVFGHPPARRSVEDMDEGIRSHMRRTHARRSPQRERDAPGVLDEPLSSRRPPASAEP